MKILDPTIATTQRLHIGPFAIRSFSPDPATTVAPEPAVVDDLWMGDGRHPVTFTVTAPEWSLDAAAWIVALLGDACRHAGVRTTVLASVAAA